MSLVLVLVMKERKERKGKRNGAGERLRPRTLLTLNSGPSLGGWPPRDQDGVEGGGFQVALQLGKGCQMVPIVYLTREKRGKRLGS